MKEKDENLLTADDREKALLQLGKDVFFEFAEKAMNKKSKTFKGYSPIEYARKGIEQYREIEEKWLPYKRQDEELEI